MKMIKKLLRSSAIAISVLSFLFPSSNVAAAVYKGQMPATAELRSGPYVGGQIGYDLFRIHQNINLGSGLLTANPMLDVNGFTGGVFLGYGYFFKNNFYLGGEGLLNYTDASINYSITDPSTSYYTKITTAGGASLALLPGYKLTPTSLIYARLGYNWDHIKATETSFSTSTNTTKWSHSFAYGLGLESLVYRNWSMRLEYTYTNNNWFKSSLGAGTHFNVTNNRFVVAALYRFT